MLKIHKRNIEKRIKNIYNNAENIEKQCQIEAPTEAQVGPQSSGSQTM